MARMVDVPGVLGTHVEPAGEPVGSAVVLPGRGYPPAAPLLAFAAQALVQHGWVVDQVWWDVPRLSDDETVAWVCDQLDRAAPASGRVLVCGKSVGSLAAPLAGERRYEAIWLTPLLEVPAVVGAIAANPARQLLVGGSADPAWSTQVADRLSSESCDVVEVAGADHGMMTPGDVVGSAVAHVDVVRAVDSFLGSSGAG
jgi:hypothetical protein